MLRRFLLILCLVVYGGLSFLYGQSTQLTVKNVNFKILDVGVNPDGVELTQNPADHLLHFYFSAEVPQKFIFYKKADTKGAWATPIINNAKVNRSSRLSIRWYCSFYQANPATQIAYEMVSCEVRYRADGNTAFTSLIKKEVQDVSFNTYSDTEDIKFPAPEIKRSVEYELIFCIRPRKILSLNIADLSAITPAPIHIYYSGTHVASQDLPVLHNTTQLWANSEYALKLDETMPFNLVPRDANNRQFALMRNYIAADHYRILGWYIDKDIVSWKAPETKLTLTFTPSTECTIVPQWLSGLPIDLKQDALGHSVPNTYEVSKNSEINLVFQPNSCHAVEKVQITTASGSQTYPVQKSDEGLYKLRYTMSEDVLNIVPEVKSLKFTLTYTSPKNCEVKFFRKEDGEEILSGTELPCGTELKLKVTSTTLSITSVAIKGENFPGGLILKKKAGDFYVPGSAGSKDYFTMNFSIWGVIVTTAPLPHRVKYATNTGSCGVFSVKDDQDTPIANGAMSSSPFIKVALNAQAPASIVSFKVTYASGKTEIRATNQKQQLAPVEFDLEENIENIEMLCEPLVSLKFSGGHYTVLLKSGKYIETDGNIGDNVGHRFAPNVVHLLANGSHIEIKVEDSYNIKPNTSFVVTKEGGTQVSHAITPLSRNWEYILDHKVSEIELKEEKYYTITYDDGIGKTYFKLKEKSAYSNSGTSYTPIATDAKVPTNALIQAGGKLVIVGVPPTPGKLQKYIYTMGGTDYEVLSANLSTAIVVSGDITKLVLVEEDDPAIAGPFTVTWNLDAAVYNVAVTYDNGGVSTPIVNGTTQVPKGRTIRVQITLVNTLAGEIQKVEKKVNNGVAEVLSAVTPGVYTFELVGKTEIAITARNRPTYKVEYEANPADIDLFVGTSSTESLTSGTLVLGGTKLYIKSARKTQADDYNFVNIKVTKAGNVEEVVTEKEGEYFVYPVEANILKIEAVYQAKPTYTVTWNVDAAVYTAEVSYEKAGNTIPIVNGTTPVREGLKVKVKITVLNTLAGELQKVEKKVNSAVPVELTPIGTGVYEFEIEGNTEIVITARNRPTYTVVYEEHPTDINLFVGTSPTDRLSTGTTVLAGTKLYIKSERTNAPEDYDFVHIKVTKDGNVEEIVASKEGDYFVHPVESNILKIEALYQVKPKVAVNYVHDQLKSIVDVKKVRDHSIVPPSTQLTVGTKLYVEVQLKNSASEEVKSVKVKYAGSSSEVELENTDGKYFFALTAEVERIDIETDLISRYTVTYTNTPDMEYTVRKVDLVTPVPSGHQVDRGTKIWVNVVKYRDRFAQPLELYVKRRNPNYNASNPKDVEYILESIKGNKIVSSTGSVYYSYVVRSDIEIIAHFAPSDVTKHHFKYSNGANYTLDVRAERTDNPTPIVADHWYEYTVGIPIFIKLTVNPLLPNAARYQVSNILVNGVPEVLELREGWYILPLTKDVYSVEFVLIELPIDKSLLVYTDPQNGRLRVYHQGVLVPSGTALPKTSRPFAVLDNMLPNSKFSITTVNGMISAWELSEEHGKHGMSFSMSSLPVTSVTAYAAIPLQEEALRSFVTVEKPEHGTLCLRNIKGDKEINQGETKEVLIGEKFEVHSVPEKATRYELVSNSIKDYISYEKGKNTPIFTVPEGSRHIRVWVVYSQVRKNFQVSWTQTSGGSVSVVNLTNDNEPVQHQGKVYAGEFIRYTIQADKGQRIAGLFLNNSKVVTGNGENYTATIRVVDRDIALSVYFEQDPNQSSLAVEDTKVLEGVLVFPNPFTAQLNITNERFNMQLSYELLSIQGLVLRRGQVLEHEVLSTEMLPAGVYLLRFVNAEGRIGVVRVVKQC